MHKLCQGKYDDKRSDYVLLLKWRVAGESFSTFFFSLRFSALIQMKHLVSEPVSFFLSWVYNKSKIMLIIHFFSSHYPNEFCKRFHSNRSISKPVFSQRFVTRWFVCVFLSSQFLISSQHIDGFHYFHMPEKLRIAFLRTQTDYQYSFNIFIYTHSLKGI